MTALREWTRRFWGTVRRRRSDRDLERELEQHLELAEEDFRRQGHSPAEAARQARLKFGRMSRSMESQRDQRGLPWLEASWLDTKLGLRMLRKSWGLTLVGGLAMTVAIGIGGFVFDFLRSVQGGSLPLDEGERVVALQTQDSATDWRRGTSQLDFERWRSELRSVEDVGAFRTVESTLVHNSGAPDRVSVAAPVATRSAKGTQMAIDWKKGINRERCTA